MLRSLDQAERYFTLMESFRQWRISSSELSPAGILAGCPGKNLCDDQVPCLLSDAALLDRAIARFKTPGLRDLSHSAPYMHNGQFATLTDIINFYIDASNLARAGTLRNGALQLQGIALTAGDVASLVAFLRSLNEDYQ